MRYAIVIEKAKINFRRRFPILGVASPLVQQLTEAQRRYFSRSTCASWCRVEVNLVINSRALSADHNAAT